MCPLTVHRSQIFLTCLSLLNREYETKMSVRTDQINLVVNVNGNDAKSKLNDLRKSAAGISSEMKELKKGTAEYVAKSKELKEVNSQMDALKKTIGITALSQKELSTFLSPLSR